MRQALHIFSKDVRYLWLEISVALAAVAALNFSVARGAANLTDYAAPGLGTEPLEYLVPLTWWALIVRAVHAEPPAGDQPFWVTRPYSRISLLGAKALFVASFVNLPKLAGDIAVLHAYGFRIPPELGGLLWTQVLLTALLILPVAALSAVTTSIVHVIMAMLVLGLAAVGWVLGTPGSAAASSWYGLEWTRSYAAGGVIAAAALLIILRQYFRRETARCRFVACSAVALAFLVFVSFPWPSAFALQSRMSEPVDVSVIRAGFDTGTESAARAAVKKSNGNVDVRIPLKVTGVPSGAPVMTEGITARIESAGAEVWSGKGDPPTYVLNPGAAVFHTTFDASTYAKMKNRPLRISGSAYLTLYGNPRSAVLPVRDRADFAPTPGVGLCSAERVDTRVFLICRTAFRSRPDFVRFAIMGTPPGPGMPARVLATLGYYHSVSYSPFPAGVDLVPVTQSMQVAHVGTVLMGGALGNGPDNRVMEVRAIALEPVAHIRREFDVSGLRLTELGDPSR